MDISLYDLKPLRTFAASFGVSNISNNKKPVLSLLFLKYSRSILLN